ncbi:glycoside hydrolase family 30 protein [Flavobacterium sp. RHBU_3]|uniref:glycoside hydrolase family 30 protein n=1 Tax=Flavobacterium sp. RHBU_3 TaxID=3391184 RepID=UPI00398482FE
MTNNKIYSRLFASLLSVCYAACSNDGGKDTGTSQPEQGITLTIDDATTYQTMEHFGASDAWSCQFVGNWPDSKKNAIADLLFSTQNDASGNPLGIGLSIWRFNVGAGSAEQGAASGIGDEWRRAESFLNSDGTYNWDKQQGQVWFAQAAKSRGVDKLLIFPNSPPVSITRNGKAFASSGTIISNLASDKYSAYADYLVAVAQGLQTKGLMPNYISPMNEPQWDWNDGGQEGTPFYNNEIASITTLLNQKIEDSNLNATISLGEAGQINYLYEVGNRPGRADQIKDFFTAGSANYVGNLSKVEPKIAGHSYFTTSPFATMVSQRQQLASAVSQVSGLKYWMSEYCILGDNAGEINGNGRDLGINPALYLAKVIHADLSVANATAWHWWLAISPYDYKDGLIYIDKEKTDGNYYKSKMLWALGNYSRFIRPGYQRVKISSSKGDSSNENFLYSAYKDPATGKLVTVVINSSAQPVSFTLKKGTRSLTGLKGYITSSDKELQMQNLTDGEAITLPARSIITITTGGL